jgi:hypothetical protein
MVVTGSSIAPGSGDQPDEGDGSQASTPDARAHDVETSGKDVLNVVELPLKPLIISTAPIDFLLPSGANFRLVPLTDGNNEHHLRYSDDFRGVEVHAFIRAKASDGIVTEDNLWLPDKREFLVFSTAVEDLKSTFETLQALAKKVLHAHSMIGRILISNRTRVIAEGDFMNALNVVDKTLILGESGVPLGSQASAVDLARAVSQCKAAGGSAGSVDLRMPPVLDRARFEWFRTHNHPEDVSPSEAAPKSCTPNIRKCDPKFVRFMEQGGEVELPAPRTGAVPAYVYPSPYDLKPVNGTGFPIYFSDLKGNNVGPIYIWKILNPYGFIYAIKEGEQSQISLYGRLGHTNVCAHFTREHYFNSL